MLWLVPAAYSLFADAILLLHFVFVAFVVRGPIVVWIGYFCHWRFVRNFHFRIAHLAAMGFVLAETLIGLACPLTTWEAKLRSLADESSYEESFIQHWVSRLPRKAIAGPLQSPYEHQGNGLIASI